MHNLHLVTIVADSPEDACAEVESFIEDFGNENNWRTICGCVSENDEVHSTEDGRWTPDEETNTIDKLNKMVQGWLTPNEYVRGQDVVKEIEGGKKFDELDNGQLHNLQAYVKEKINIFGLNTENFNVLEDEYCSWEYDENGVTYCEWGRKRGRKEKGTKYVVLVDMHS
jgi:hypothetical protein